MKIFSFRDVAEGRQQDKSAEFSDDYDLCNPGIDCSNDEVITKQSFASECDVNLIMARYENTGVVSLTNKLEPRYGEHSAIELADALNTVIEAEDMFNKLPAKIRAKFSNDPVLLMAAVDDESQHDLLRELGIMKPKEDIVSELSTTPTVDSMSGNGG